MSTASQSSPPISMQAHTQFRADHRTIARRGIEAAIWGMPLVAVDALRRAFFAAGAKYGDILYFSRPANWKFQTPTPNASSLYVYFNFNLKDGPMVLEVPPANEAGLFGSLVDAWQVPLADVGPEGEDGGAGAKYVLLPPGYRDYPDEEAIQVPCGTYNGYALFRAVPTGSASEDRNKAIALIKKIRFYRLEESAAPPQQNHIDIAGTMFEGLVHFDASFYDGLARMVNEEPVRTRDFVAMGQLRSLGIVKGQPFKPDSGTGMILRHAASEAHAHFMKAMTIGTAYWPGSQWIVSVSVGPKTGFTYMTDDRLEIDERGTTFFVAYAAPKNLGAASFYVAAYYDAKGAPLSGHKTYRLRVPANVPVEQYWAVTVYDVATAGFIRESPRVGIDSYNEQAVRNEDGSMDIYFGPLAPAGHETNWIYTQRGTPWFTFFRFYGPQKPVFDKSWPLPNIEPME